MFDRLIFFGLIVVFVLGPLVWRLWRDRVNSRALIVRAEIDSAFRRALGGESFVAVEVVGATILHRGRIHLSVPRDWNYLVRDAWDDVVNKLPTDHDLVIHL